MTRAPRHEQLRELLNEVARLVVNDGHHVEHALARAAKTHNLSLRQLRPSREELRQAIADYRELFRPEQLTMLKAQRALALEAMRSLAVFEPRLFGNLVQGDGPLDRIRLLLYADSAEQVLMHLHDQRIPWRESEVELHYSGNRRRSWPAVLFMAGQTQMEVVILDRQSFSDPPRDSIDGSRLETLDIAQLEALLRR